MNNWHCSMNFCHLASLSSEQLGRPSILRTSEVIRLKFGDILEHTEGYSTLFFEPIGPGPHGGNASGIFSVWEGFTPVFQYLKMSERAGRTQGVGEYCKRGLQWILSNWNSGIPPIIGVAVWISVISRQSRSRQLGAPSVLGRNGVIQLRLGHIIEYAKCCSKLHFWADWARSSWRKTLVKICIMGRYFRICGCQNWVQGPRDWVYTVERRLDRFYTLGMVRFPRLLGFHQDFQS